jgi:glutathione S-transferase
MKLYTYDPAPNPRRLSLFLKHKGLEIDSQQVDLMTGEHLGEAYGAINPQHTVPALVLDDGTVLTEVIGIVTYLEALHPEKPLLGTTPLEKALVSSWDHHLFVGLMTAVASMLRNASKGFQNRALPGPLDLPQLPALAERGLLQLQHILPELDAHLAGRAWLAGDNPTFADIDLLVGLDFIGWVKQSIPEECTNLRAYQARVKAEFDG